MKDLMVSLRMFLFWTLLLGLGYPAFVTGVSQLLMHRQANGGILSRGGQVIGSDLIGQKFENSNYFWSRPSAVDDNPLASGGSNLGPTSEALKTLVTERDAKLRAANPGAGDPPEDLLFASASGLDPQISPQAAVFQSARVAKARGLSSSEIQSLIDQATEARQLGVLGEPRVNVLALNLALDQKQGVVAAPTPAPIQVPSQASPLAPPAASTPASAEPAAHP